MGNLNVMERGAQAHIIRQNLKLFEIPMFQKEPYPAKPSGDGRQGASYSRKAAGGKHRQSLIRFGLLYPNP